MARKPVYGNHKGSARTTVNGKRVYLGTFNCPESLAAFDKIIAEWEAAHAERSPTVNVVSERPEPATERRFKTSHYES